MELTRELHVKLVFVIGAAIIITRLFYIQVVRADELKIEGSGQYKSVSKVVPRRGDILSSDKYPLATAHSSYLLIADPKTVKPDYKEIVNQLSQLLDKASSPEAKLKFEANTIDNLSRDLRWIMLERKVSPLQKEKIESAKISGLSFEEEFIRINPEASLAAHLLGFVGRDENGQDKGYFGLEGYYNLNLAGFAGKLSEEKDLVGKPIMIGNSRKERVKQGRTLITSIDRPAQFLVERKLEEGLAKYGAKSGTVTLIEPSSGRILAMASLPSYTPSQYSLTNQESFKNPVVADTYEPGSTFKVIVMAAAINEGIVTPSSICDRCSGPVTLDKYTIRTWDNKYRPNETMTDIITNSDNVGMVYVGDKLGTEKFIEYYKLFGFSKATGIDLQEEIIPPQRPGSQWSPIDRSTASFGQGIAVTPIQMVKAISVIANGGKSVTPRVVDRIMDSGKEIPIPAATTQQIISTQTAHQITQMMVEAVEKGESKWTKPKGFKIAGKTGTAQIPVSGHYDQEKTIASFIGFAPADNPKFAMLVTLQEPKSSPWGSETAAPLWFSIARDLFRLWGITS